MSEERAGRREFMARAGAASAVAGLSPGLSGCAEDEAPPDVQTLELVTGWIEKTFDGERVRLRAYDGQVPGPTITTRPGQLLEIALVNELDDYAAKSWTRADTWNGDHNVPHHLGTTNLHVHGLEVLPHLFEPLGTEDPAASMIAVPPEGGVQVYPFQIPSDHPSGLFWYHPHHHGSTVVQAVSGMAGPIIVEGPIDEVPEIAAARDVLVAVQDIGLFRSDDPDDPDAWVYEPVQNAIWQSLASDPAARVTIYDASTGMAEPTPLNGGFTTGDYALRFYLVDGEPFYREEHNDGTTGECPGGGMPSQSCPVGTQLGDGLRLSIAPGEVVRLRMLNGCSDLVMPMHLEGHELHLIALDGVNFTAPRTITTQYAEIWDGRVDYSSAATSLVLAPANRAEFLVKGGAPGTYRLVQLAHVDQQFMAADEKVVATITVEGEPMDMALPTALPEPTRHYPLITPGELVDDSYVVEFEMAFPGVLNPTVGLDFMIGEQIYAEHETTKQVRLGTAEQWTLRTHDTMEGHPFHVHVNSFEVISIAGVDQPPGTIMDTIWVPKPPTMDGATEVVIRSRYKQWSGKSVYHCHILPHEDTGMMRNFLILP
ncbi:multicopper oxidase family protein [Paraliomyxa miuraensis]|uniref:multicopper oxidase family protein n=1 Tax=Paraliomyxa miuraensis TaxID=376150 RepID=UPI00224DED5F|nr:multicopper oxidase domain-containing protein [Paraliomyxa miuraensis]MCX4240393.1 multicopper oxidase domain-containing protein [Paraliomyxa miuraensis]